MTLRPLPASLGAWPRSATTFPTWTFIRKEVDGTFDELMSRRSDIDPEFEKAKAILKGIMDESPNPHPGEERLRVHEELSKHIDVSHLAALALAHWFNDAYDDLLEDYPAKPGS